MNIPASILLPKLSAAERKSFDELSNAYRRAQRAIADNSSDAIRSRKRALKASASESDNYTEIAGELNTAPETMLRARSLAKRGLRQLGKRYVALLPLIEKADAHADLLLSVEETEQKNLFAKFGVEPSGETPVRAALLAWKASLARAREQMAPMLRGEVPPIAPYRILPYATKSEDTNPLS